MDDDERPPWVPGPREGGREDPGHPHVPAPRAAPALERLPRPAGTVTTMTERPAPARSAALVPTSRASTALAVRDDPVASRLRAWGRGVLRVVACVVGAAAAGVRSVLDTLTSRAWAPCPAVRCPPPSAEA